jgi:hypothetical protein
MCSETQGPPLLPKNLLALIYLYHYTVAMIPKNILKFRLDGFPVDALDQKRMRRLRFLSERTGAPIPQLIRSAIDQAVGAWIAEAELPNKILKFPTEIG